MSKICLNAQVWGLPSSLLTFGVFNISSVITCLLVNSCHIRATVVLDLKEGNLKKWETSLDYDYPILTNRYTHKLPPLTLVRLNKTVSASCQSLKLQKLFNLQNIFSLSFFFFLLLYLTSGDVILSFFFFFTNSSS